MIGRVLSISPPRRWLEQNRQALVRCLVVPGVLLASAYLGPRVSERRLILLLGGGMALVFLRWPPLGLATLIPASLVVPFALGTGTQTSLNVSVLLVLVLVGLWVLDMVHRREVRLLSSAAIPPLLALSVVAVVSFLAGNVPWFVFAQPASVRAQVGALFIFLLSAGAFLLVAHQVQDLRWLERLTWLFLALGGVYIAGRSVPGLDRFVGHLFQYGATGSLFWVWLVALAFSQAAFNGDLQPRWRLTLGLLVAATFYVGLFSSRSWASGWLPPLAAVMAILWTTVPRLGLLTTLLGGVVVALNMQRAIGLVMINEQYSAVTRWEAWRILVEIVKVNPVLGLGPANYSHYTHLYSILGYYVSFNSHNQYIDIVAQTGLVGLACFSWFVWQIARLGWRLRVKVPEGFARAYVYGALGGLVGTLVAGLLGDWVLPYVYNIGLVGFRASMLGWLFLGGLVVLERVAVEANDRSSDLSATVRG